MALGRYDEGHNLHLRVETGDALPATNPYQGAVRALLKDLLDLATEERSDRMCDELDAADQLSNEQTWEPLAGTTAHESVMLDAKTLARLQAAVDELGLSYKYLPCPVCMKVGVVDARTETFTCDGCVPLPKQP